MPLQSSTDKELLALLRNDDALAYKELYDRHWYNLYITAYRKLRRRDVAEELAQELFVMLWQKRKTLQVINLGAYLGVSLKHLMVDYVRKNIQEEHYLEHLQQFLPIDDLATADTIQLNELTEAVQKVLAQLPEKTRDIFVMNRFEHLTIREIAQKVGLSEKTIEYHLARSTTFLRQHLRDFAPSLVLFILS